MEENIFMEKNEDSFREEVTEFVEYVKGFKNHWFVHSHAQPSDKNGGNRVIIAVAGTPLNVFTGLTTIVKSVAESMEISPKKLLELVALLTDGKGTLIGTEEREREEYTDGWINSVALDDLLEEMLKRTLNE